MRIFFAIEGLGRGGKERQISILFSSIDNIENGKRIIAKKIDTKSNYLKEYGIKEDEIILSNGFMQFYKVIKEHRPDVIFTWDLQSSIYSLILMKFLKFKFINGSIRHGIRGRKLYHYLRSLVAWMSPVVVANSHAGLHANNLKKGNKRIVLYNGIEDKFKEKISDQKKISELRVLFPNYDYNNEIVFISVANLVPYKDYFTVLDSLNNIKKKLGFRYLIIGDGPLRGEIENKISQSGLNDRICVIGKSSNVEYYLKMSDVMLHSSKGEGISNAILEGMYAGLPIIASDVGGIPETVYKPFSFLFRYKNVAELTSFLMRSKELLKIFNSDDPSYKEHLDKFSLVNMISNFHKIIKEC